MKAALCLSRMLPLSEYAVDFASSSVFRSVSTLPVFGFTAPLAPPCCRSHARRQNPIQNRPHKIQPRSFRAHRPLSDVPASYRVKGLWSDVRFGSLADMLRCEGDACFTAESGHMRCKNKCRLWANSGPSGLSGQSATRRPLTSCCSFAF
jgi:hypothetical protein